MKDTYIHFGFVNVLVAIEDAIQWSYEHWDREEVSPSLDEMGKRIWSMLTPEEKEIARIRIRHLLSGGTETTPEEMKLLRDIGYVR